MVTFAVLGAIDYILGNRFGIGKEFERGINFAGIIILSMVGMIVLSGYIGHVLQPVANFINTKTPFDASILSGMFLANDMGGADLSLSLAKTEQIGLFNGLIVGSTMGATISFTLPLILTLVKKEKLKNVLLGMICGIITVPIGCIVAGLIAGTPFVPMLLNLIPLLIVSIVLVILLLKAPNFCIKIFSAFGKILRVVIIIGLVFGIVELCLDKTIPHMTSVKRGIDIVAGAVAVLAGAFPLIAIINKLLRKPSKWLGKKLGVCELSASSFVGTLATNVTTFENSQNMDEKGVVLNSAFAVSGSWVFAGHLAFTLSFNATFVLPVIVGKLVGAISAVILAWFIYKLLNGKKSKQELAKE